jgi:VWFA-related protein
VVDVVVVDGTGDPVRGLKASDFVLVDRKTPQKIATFDEVSHEREQAAALAFAAAVRRDVADNQTAQSDRLVILVVDDLHIWKGRTDRAKEIASTIVSDLGPQSSMAILFTSREHSTQITGDRAVLSEALETFKGRQAWRRPHEAIDSQKDNATASLQDFFDNMTQYKTLEDAARMLGAGDARRKAFVMISEGIGKDLTGVFDGDVTPCEARCGGCPCYHEGALRTMMESLRRSNVTAYSVDPRGHIPAAALALEAFPSPPALPANAGSTRPADGMGDDPASGGFRWNNPIRQAQDGLRILAEASGGFAIVDTDDFQSGLRRIIEDLDHYYLLGFYPSDPKGKEYELRVSAMSTKLGTGGSVYLDLEVPDGRKAPLEVGGLLVSRSTGPGVPVAPPVSRRPAGRSGIPAPVAAAVLPFPPSLDRAFASTDDLRVYFEAIATNPRGLNASIEVLDASGKVVRSPSPSFALGDPIRVQGLVPLAGLRAGTYVLRGTLGDGSHSATSQTAFVIR